MQGMWIRGGRPLRGVWRVSGAKNAALKMMAAALMATEKCVITDVPAINDVRTMMGVMRHLGADVQLHPNGRLDIVPPAVDAWEAPEHLVRQMRASVLVMGPVLAKTGRVRIALPGGCAIGPRPIDLHLRGLRLMGARIVEERGFVEAHAARLRGAEIQLDFPSVGATENLMMAATLATGTTVIRNAAREPEIIDLQTFLNSMGAKVVGAGTDTIRVVGVEGLRGARHAVMPDRIEAGTAMVAAAVTGGDIVVQNVIPEHLEAVTAKLREAGVEVAPAGPGGLRVRGSGRPRSFYVRTQPHPGFPTDMQPQFMALASVAEGSSIIKETVYTSRMKHADELRRMGADIVVDGSVAVVRGVERLTGAVVEAPDLRAGAALVPAGRAGDGEPVVEGPERSDRGYELFEEKLQAVGAEVRRMAEDTPVAGGRPLVSV
ncbi:MAG: UDP-N-acetylglucosamine 1-carboxyvinyltransferase [Bacillota bacterium]|nr:MAG: UDP-N-acetylglucosamine 1-carboxyvinyltransferase [Bacillota bacterium]